VPLEINPLQESLRIALKAMSTPDFTHGSTFYHHIDVAPKWANGKLFIGRYGSHKFYRHHDTPLSAAAF
jgi:N-acetylmuramoyl-L-alanine amidase